MAADAFNNINFNLLIVLRALLRTQSVTDAAELVGRSPSTVSTALGQLRVIFRDPLFVADGRGLKPTARALQLTVPVERALHHINAVFDPQGFDPGRSDRRVTIAASDILVAFEGPKILAALQSRGPQMSLKFEGMDRDLVDKMGTRLVDFALLPEMVVGRLAPLQLSYLPLTVFYLDTVLMRRGHPLATRKKLSQRDLRRFPHAAFRPDDPLSEHIHSHPGMDFDARVILNQSLAIPSFVAGSDLIAVGAAAQFAGLGPDAGLTTVPLTPRIPIPYGLAWSSVFENDDAHGWLRTLIADALRPQATP